MSLKLNLLNGTFCNFSSLRMSGYGLSFILCMCLVSLLWTHYKDVIMGEMASQITSLTIVYRLFRRRSKKTSKLRVTGLCEGNSPVTGEFPAQMASNMNNVPIWWHYHVIILWQGALPSVDYKRSWHNLDVFLLEHYKVVCLLFRCWNDFFNIASMAFLFFWYGAKMRTKFMLLSTRNPLSFSLSIISIMDVGISMYCGMSQISLTYIPSMPCYVSSS